LGYSLPIAKFGVYPPQSLADTTQKNWGRSLASAKRRGGPVHKSRRLDGPAAICGGGLK